MAELCRHLYNDNKKTFHYSTFLKNDITVSMFFWNNSNIQGGEKVEPIIRIENVSFTYKINENLPFQFLKMSLFPFIQVNTLRLSATTVQANQHYPSILTGS